MTKKFLEVQRTTVLMQSTARAFQLALVEKNSAVNVGEIRDAGLIPGLGRFPEGGNGNPLQYSCLENFMDGGAWQATVHGVTKNQA